MKMITECKIRKIISGKACNVTIILEDEFGETYFGEFHVDIHGEITPVYGERHWFNLDDDIIAYDWVTDDEIVVWEGVMTIFVQRD